MRASLRPVLGITSAALVGSLAVAGCTSTANSKSAASVSSASVSSASMGSGLTGSTSSTSSGPSGGGSAQAIQQAYINVVHNVLPSVVEITTSQGLGSGIVYDNQGDIVTNDHVVGSATSFEVRLANGASSYQATLVGTYTPDDLAVIKVSGAKDLHPATFGDSSKLVVGDIVLAMGNPLGLASSVTNGIVSATGRTVSEPQSADSPGATLPDVIQTSAAINPGNSGGALVGLAGQVVGIPTLAAQDSQQGGAAPGIGFAIPSNIVKDIAHQLVTDGKVTNSHRAGLGVGVVTVTDQQGNPAGAGIVKVMQGGAAASAGLATGDVITSINGTPTPDTTALATVLANLKPGQQVSVDYVKPDGSKASVHVTLGTLSGS
jgi:putative serine protease PepD